MAESIAGRKDGLRCEHPDNRPGGVCGKLLMELRDGQLGIAHRADNGDHFTPLNVLLSQAKQHGWLPNETEQGGSLMNVNEQDELKLLEDLLRKAKGLVSHGRLSLEAPERYTCSFKLDGIRVMIRIPKGWTSLPEREIVVEYRKQKIHYTYDPTCCDLIERLFCCNREEIKIRGAANWLYEHRPLPSAQGHSVSTIQRALKRIGC